MAESSGSFTIGGSSPDYATIQLWDDDAAVTLTGVLEGKCRVGDYAENITIGGSTTTSSNFKRLTYDTGAFHNRDFFGGAQLRGTRSGSTDHVIQIVEEDYTEIIGLNFNRWVGTSNEAIRFHDNGGAMRATVEQCLFWGSMNTNADGIFFNATNASSVLYVANSIFAFLGRSSILVQGSAQDGTIRVRNCTAVHMAGSVQGLDDATSTTFSYPGMGDDVNSGPTTNGVTWDIQNTYVHTTPDAQGTIGPCFYKVSQSSWSNSTHNASADTTASDTNATNYQNSAAVLSQFVNMPDQTDVGENTGADYTVTTEDSQIRSDSPTTNYGSLTVATVDEGPIINYMMRMDFADLPDATRVLGAMCVVKKDSALGGNPWSGTFYQLKRNWTEGGVTYNKYDGTNDWTTAGALGAGNDIETYNIDGNSVTVRSFSLNRADVAANEWYIVSGGEWVPWVQQAIDGDSPSGKGGDWIDVITRWFSTTGHTSFYASDHNDGNRPEFRIFVDTPDDPMELLPVPGGVLDGNATDVSSETNYAISTDLMGVTRSNWDIGAIESGTATWVTQAGVEVLQEPTPARWFTQAGVEVLQEPTPARWFTQAGVEVLYEEVLGEDELGVAAVILALTTNTPTPERITPRFATVAYPFSS